MNQVSSFAPYHIISRSFLNLKETIMMETVVRLNADELHNSFIDFIKSSFKGKKITVHIYEEEQDETEYLLSDPITKKRLLDAIKNVGQNRELKEYTIQEISSYLNENDAEHYS